MVLSFAGLAVTILQTLIVPIIPELPGILGVGPADASWVITATLVAGAVATPSLSRLADMYGKRRMLLVSLGFMLAGSVLLASTTSFVPVVIGRAMQGVSTAVIPIGMSVMRDVLPTNRLPGAVATMSAMFGIGGALGLPLAGVLYHAWGWGALFWAIAAAAAVTTVGVILVVPESGIRTGGSFDWLGALLLSGALLGLLLAITKGADWGWLGPNTVICAVVALIGFAMFVPWQLRAARPLVNLVTMMRRPVLLTNLASALVSFAMYVNMLTTTQMLQVPRPGFGLSTAEAGLGMLPAAIMSILLAPVAAKLIGRVGARNSLIIGAAILGGGYLARIFLVGAPWMVIAGAAALSGGTALALATMPVLIMQAVPVTQTAAANGLNSLLRSIGTSASSAVVAAVLAGTTMLIGGVLVPAPEAFATMHLIAAIAAVIALVLATRIPARPRA